MCNPASATSRPCNETHPSHSGCDSKAGEVIARKERRIFIYELRGYEQHFASREPLMNDRTKKALIENLANYTWNGLWLVEWNEDQKQFHVESAHTRFSDSIGSFLQKQKNGAWVSLGIFNSREDAQGFADLLRDQRGL